MIYFFKFLIFSMTCYGISNIEVYSNGLFNIFSKWRKWINDKSETFGELFSCMMCLPFWVGLIISLIDILFMPKIDITPYNILLDFYNDNIYMSLFILFMDGCIASGSVWLIHNIEEFFESNSKYE